MTRLQAELAAIGLFVSRQETVALAQLTSATDFEHELAAIGVVDSRAQAHRVLQALKARARPHAIRPAVPDGAALGQTRMMQNANGGAGCKPERRR
jgi:hypothetical protein